MVVLSTLALAASLAGIAQASPAARAAADDVTFVPAMGYERIPVSQLRTASKVVAPKVEHLTFSPEEFQAWAVNGSHVTEPPAFMASGAGKRGTVIGNDDRYSRQSTDFPWGAIGRLYMPQGNGWYGWCTGTLVGPRLMAAARHCISSEAQYYQFQPGYNHGDKLPSAYVKQIISLNKGPDSDCELQNDWALYVLDQPLGTQRGFFKVGNYQNDNVENKNILYSAGYPGDLDGGQSLYQSDFRTTQLSRRSQCPAGGPITGDADVMGGMSGGPLWRLDGSNRITYGTLFGAFVDGNGNELASIHAHGPQFIQGVNNLNAQNP